MNSNDTKAKLQTMTMDSYMKWRQTGGKKPYKIPLKQRLKLLFTGGK